MSEALAQVERYMSDLDAARDASVREIIELEKLADDAEIDASVKRYRATQIMMCLLDEGMAVKELARRIGKDPKHVRKCRNAWEAMHPEGGHPAPPHEFQRYYRAVGIGSRGPGSSPRRGKSGAPGNLKVDNADRLRQAEVCLSELDTSSAVDPGAVRRVAELAARLRPARCPGYDRIIICRNCGRTLNEHWE